MNEIEAVEADDLCESLGEAVATVIRQAEALTPEQIRRAPQLLVLWDAALNTAWAAARAAAAVVSDQVEQHGLIAKHIADLTRAWREVIGAA